MSEFLDLISQNLIYFEAVFNLKEFSRYQCFGQYHLNTLLYRRDNITYIMENNGNMKTPFCYYIKSLFQYLPHPFRIEYTG